MLYDNEYEYGTDENGDYRQRVNKVTGEVIGEREYRPQLYIKQGTYLLPIDPTKRKNKTGFIRVFHENTLPLIKSNKFTNNEWGIIFKLMHLVDWESNYLVDPDTSQLMNIVDIVEYLHIRRESLESVIKKMSECGMISVNGPDQKYRPKTFNMNAKYVLRGKKLKDENTQKVFDKPKRDKQE